MLSFTWLQMNALLEPWNDDALSEEISWGAAPALAQSADALADTAASGGLPGIAGLGPGQEYQMAVTYRGAKVRGFCTRLTHTGSGGFRSM
jgi:hypothetical protein